MDIKIIGVYSIKADEPCHMIEMKIQRLGFDLDFGSFTQEIPGEAEDNWQVPYDEQVLNSEGTMILNPNYPDEIPEADNFRVAFYFHYLDLTKPLKTPIGDLILPAVTEKPDRLNILKYDSPD